MFRHSVLVCIKTLMHSCYFCMMHPGVILGLRGSMVNGMTNVDTITSKYFEFGAPHRRPTSFLTQNTFLQLPLSSYVVSKACTTI